MEASQNQKNKHKILTHTKKLLPLNRIVKYNRITILIWYLQWQIDSKSYKKLVKAKDYK